MWPLLSAACMACRARSREKSDKLPKVEMANDGVYVSAEEEEEDEDEEEAEESLALLRLR